ncbi:PREDICTED: probable serine/threonine-protein kinase At1g54610 isoform X2 [Camelina sativa]|uniref:Probable serine/threonine-protein kinase At1g54610 isoform X2 n=1 Tax=Camelina sativa TaxID=90675 RepID=A0ABM0TM67_CAMSA|nr:PREDICTED: probable serine/threonine-protein kinase At1g54610 isoform X2 [Camelina sativa]
MGCVSSKQTVSVTPAIDHSFRENENNNECSGSGREDPPIPTLKKLVSWRSKSGKRRSQKTGSSELGNESGRGSDSLSFRLGNFSRYLEAEHVAAGWPAWLSNVAGEAIHGWVPLRSDSFEKLEKIGQGTYSSVFRAVESETGRIVALKKVRFDNFEPESVKFMAREILILRRLNHPNIIKLEGLITSKLSCNIQLVFEYMEHDLTGLLSSPDIKFTTPQIKCYMKQLLSGLDHCHSRGVMHRDIKGSNLLLSNEGILKVADFGLANFSNSSGHKKKPLTSRVVTLWYRPPELLLGATDYGASVDMWSVGCVFAELLLGKPILRGRTEVEQLHKIFKLCGSPPEDYWKKSKLPHAMLFKPQQNYDSCLRETLKDLSETEINLIETLLSIDPHKRGTASSALVSQYFTTKPFACYPSSLPIYPPSKEIDSKHRDEATRKKISGNGRRGTDARKPSRKAHSFNKLAPDARHQTETFQKRIGHLVHNSIGSDVRLCEKLQNPLDHKKDEASHMKNASQGDVPFSGPLQVSKSNSFAWAKREKDDVCVRVHNRSLSRGHIPNLSVHSPAFNGKSNVESKINKNENEAKCEDKTDSRGQESYEMVKRSMLKQWRQLERPDSFGASGEYHSQELSLGLSQRDEMARKLGNNLGNGDKIEFSGPLLSQSYGVDELLERHERHIRKLIRKPWFQKDKKQTK